MCAEKAVRKNEKGKRTKQKLFETATQLFDQYDFDSVTVDAIVEAAGLSKGTFYIYFESKYELITAFLLDYVDKVDSSYKAHLELLPAETTAHDMIISLVEKISDELINTIGYERMRVVYKGQLSGMVNMEGVIGYNRKLYKIFADVLMMGVEKGEFSSAISIESLTKHFVIAIRGISYEWCIRYPDFYLKEQAVEHFKLLLRGIEATPLYPGASEK